MEQRTSPTAETRPEQPSQLSLVRLGTALRPLVVPTLVAGVLGALAVVVWVRYFLPDRYTSAALLLVEASTGKESSSFLGLQGYQQLLESDEVVGRTTRQLQKRFPDRKPKPRAGRELTSRRIGDGRGGGEGSRLLRVEAHGRDPEVTAAAAEIWVSTFLDKCGALATGSLQARAKEIDDLLVEANADEEGLHGERQRLTGLIEGAYQGTLVSWDRRLAKVKAGFRDELAEFDAETRDQVDDFEDRHQMGVRRLKVATLADAYRQLALDDPDTPIEDGTAVEAEAGAGSETKPPVPETDLDDDPSVPSDEESQLASVSSDTVKPTIGPANDVADVKRKLMTKGDKVRRDEALLKRLERERLNARRAIEDRQALELQVLERQRQADLYAASEAQADELTTVERQLRDTETILNSLVRRRSVLDVKRNGCGVEVAAAAVRPARPEPRRTLPKALIGLVVGAALGFVLALAREVGRAGRTMA
ncbi:MAG: hypothetical protein KDD11_04775 [Acidobacteria bacterium]|nr:hypothetical protein [Acidobacteriota bacterium]